MVAKKKVKKMKPAEKQTFLRPEDRLELLEALNGAKNVIDSNLEWGSSSCNDAHDAQHKINMVASKLGYKYSEEKYYGKYTL